MKGKSHFLLLQKLNVMLVLFYVSAFLHYITHQRNILDQERKKISCDKLILTDILNVHDRVQRIDLAFSKERCYFYIKVLT